MRRTAPLILATTLLLLAGCASSNSSTAAPDESAASEPSETAEGSRCVDVDQSTIDAMSGGLTAADVELANWKAVKSEGYDQVWFVSAIAGGGGFDGEIFTFATNDDPTQPGIDGLTLAADAMTDEFTDWPYGPDTEFGVSFIDDGGEESRDCAEAATS